MDGRHCDVPLCAVRTGQESLYSHPWLMRTGTEKPRHRNTGSPHRFPRRDGRHPGFWRPAVCGHQTYGSLQRYFRCDMYGDRDAIVHDGECVKFDIAKKNGACRATRQKAGTRYRHRCLDSRRTAIDSTPDIPNATAVPGNPECSENACSSRELGKCRRWRDGAQGGQSPFMLHRASAISPVSAPD